MRAQKTEARLEAENQAVNKERGQLSDLLCDLQSMQNELERTNKEGRDRLDASVSRLEAQLCALSPSLLSEPFLLRCGDAVVAHREGTREALSKETEALRQLMLRREVESKDFQDRIERLVRAISPFSPSSRSAPAQPR